MHTPNSWNRIVRIRYKSAQVVELPIRESNLINSDLMDLVLLWDISWPDPFNLTVRVDLIAARQAAPEVWLFQNLEHA